MRPRAAAVLFAPLLPFTAMLLSPAPARAEEQVDLAVVHKIKQEAFRNGAVMDHLFFLTDVNGPRLTASPGFRKAADWSVRSLKEWGLGNARLEVWGPFGRSWTVTRYSVNLREPGYAPLGGIPKAWSSGTAGPVTAEVVSAPIYSAVELAREVSDDIVQLTARIKSYTEAQKGKLRGKIVLIVPPRELEPPTKAVTERYGDETLTQMAQSPVPFVPPTFEWPITKLPEDLKKREQLWAALPSEVHEDYWERWGKAFVALNAFLKDDGVVAVLTTDTRGDGGIVFAEEAGSWQAGLPTPPPVIALSPEAYDRLSRLVEKKIPVKVEVDVGVDSPDTTLDGVNVIAEIPGGRKKDDIVMLGAHLDSWHAGTGATDNAAGCAVALEAIRILKTLNLGMDRTVRLALWSGEEQGLFGSRRYVKTHFGDPLTMALKPEHARLAGYFNVDNGSGKIRGVYLQGNDMVRPIFEAWLAPFHDLGAGTMTIDVTTGTDHLSFDDVGLPGFQFIQDPLDYETRTHHSNLDVYDHLQAGDLMQASAILASFVYNAATRPEMLPRKPLPKALPQASPSGRSSPKP